MNEYRKENEDSWMLLVLLLKNIAEEKHVTHENIADKLGMHRSSISRIFSLRFCPTLKMFISIAQVLGVNFFFEDKESKTDLSVAFEQAMTELGRRKKGFSPN